MSDIAPKFKDPSTTEAESHARVTASDAATAWSGRNSGVRVTCDVGYLCANIVPVFTK